MAHLSRARTLIDPLFCGFFFQGQAAGLMSREATMLQGRREVRLLRLSLVRPAAPNTYGGSAGCPCQGEPTAFSSLPLPGERAAKKNASQKLYRAPCWPCKASRLTWASEAAAWSRQFAGRQVRCRLNRRAAVASSLPTPPRLARGVLQLVIRIPAYRMAGQSN
jgi:hypothetical protein